MKPSNRMERARSVSFHPFAPLKAAKAVSASLLTLTVFPLVTACYDSFDDSLQNAASQPLYLVAARVEKDVGKTAVDTFFMRLDDVLSVCVVWLGVRLAVSTPLFFGFIAVWTSVVMARGREQRRPSGEMERHAAQRPGSGEIGSGVP